MRIFIIMVTGMILFVTTFIAGGLAQQEKQPPCDSILQVVAQERTAITNDLSIAKALVSEKNKLIAEIEAKLAEAIEKADDTLKEIEE